MWDGRTAHICPFAEHYCDRAKFRPIALAQAIRYANMFCSELAENQMKNRKEEDTMKNRRKFVGAKIVRACVILILIKINHKVELHKFHLKCGLLLRLCNARRPRDTTVELEFRPKVRMPDADEIMTVIFDLSRPKQFLNVPIYWKIICCQSLAVNVRRHRCDVQTFVTPKYT